MSDGLTLLTPPRGEPIGLAEAKRWCRVDADDASQDAEVLAAVAAARDYAERQTGRKLVSARWRLTLNRLPACGRVVVPLVPLQSVTSVSYYDTNNSLQTLAASYYEADRSRLPGAMLRAWNQTWPDTYDRHDAARIDFWAGYGPSTETTTGFEAGERTVTPASMDGVFADAPVVVGDGPERETVVVSSVTSATFTATFVRGHPDPCPILPALPPAFGIVLRLLVAHWFRNREAVAGGGLSQVAIGANALLDGLYAGGYA